MSTTDAKREANRIAARETLDILEEISVLLVRVTRAQSYTRQSIPDEIPSRIPALTGSSSRIVYP